jgi:hypothetical protein
VALHALGLVQQFIQDHQLPLANNCLGSYEPFYALQTIKKTTAQTTAIQIVVNRYLTDNISLDLTRISYNKRNRVVFGFVA